MTTCDRRPLVKELLLTPILCTIRHSYLDLYLELDLKLYLVIEEDTMLMIVTIDD